MRGDDESAEAHRQFYDEYNAVLDMPAEYYLDTIRIVFQDFALVNGTWDVRRRAACARRRSRRTALLTIEGELDDISGSGQTARRARAVHRRPEAAPDHYDVEGAGHYGIFCGRRWREQVYPEVREFIARYSTRPGRAGTEPRANAQAQAQGRPQGQARLNAATVGA